jgi:hypothetical protein
MADRDTLGTLAGEFAAAFQRFGAAFRTPVAFADLLEEMGWRFDSVPQSVTNLQGPIGAVLQFISQGQVAPEDIPALLGLILDAFTAISDLENASDVPAEFQSEFPRQLVDFMLVDYFLARQPRWGFLLMALRIIRLESAAPAGRPPFVRRVFAVEDLGTLLSDPLTFLKSSYQWGQPGFDGSSFSDSIGGLLKAWGLPVRYPQLDTQTLGQVTSGAVAPDQIANVSPQVPLIEDALDPGTFAAGAGLFLLPQTGTDNPGFAVLPYATAGFTDEIAIRDNVSLTINGEVDLTGIVGIFVRPDKDVTFLSAMDSGSPAPVTGDLTFALKLGQPGQPLVILGTPNASRLELGGVSTTAGARFRSELELFTEVALEAGKIVVKPSSDDMDGFLASLLPGDGVEIDIDLTIGFSTTKGVYFGASGTFEIVLPAHLSVGSIEVESASIALRPNGGAIPVDLAATVIGDLSVLKATVQNVGVTAAFSFPSDRKGNLGPVDLALQFKAPDGVGLSVDAGSVHGGGFISFDPTAGRYSGALQLSIYDIAVNAFGLIDTKVPGVSYSFVIIISAQFTPIQLGFGFTLNGVGGMVGINRGIDTAALANLVRAGQSEDLLFPQNVVADAPTIVRDLTTVFPATQGRYVFGPLGKLGWGTPTLITGEIGVILEVPGPVVVILGEVKCILPKSDAALVKLNLSVDGELDFPNKTFAMDAALHDSVINGFPVSGQMAMRIAWGDQPNFVFSIGGFHPAYTPPPNFPKLQPMALDLGSHGPAKISVSGFFAMTSNTVQVGGTAALHASGSGISLDASVSVKALFVFQPFSFEADIDASVKISFHGYGPSVHLSGTLAGPSPWHVKGEVCVSIFWWDACLGFDVTFGGSQQVTQPEIDPWVGVPSSDPTAAILGLHDALSDPGNWSGASIPGTVSSVTRAQGTDTLIDPVGGLTVRQKTAPVETANPLTKFGVAKVSAPITFSNVQATLGAAGSGVPLTAIEPVNEFFAPAQFFDMDDGKKLSSAGFEQYQSGYLFATANGNVQGGSTVTLTPAIQTFVINSDGSDTPLPNTYTPSNPAVTAASTRSAVARGGLTQAGTRRFVDRGFAQAFTENVPTFVIASNTTMQAATSAPVQAVRSATLIALDTFRAQHIEQAAGVQVAAIHELAA